MGEWEIKRERTIQEFDKEQVFQSPTKISSLPPMT
jgi:hypothetical protein